MEPEVTECLPGSASPLMFQGLHCQRRNIIPNHLWQDRLLLWFIQVSFIIFQLLLFAPFNLKLGVFATDKHPVAFLD